MIIQMKTVINWDFSNCNHFILTNQHNSKIIDSRHSLNFSPISQRNTQFHISFPKHNLNFPLASLRNTWFHIIFWKHNLNFSLVSLRNTQFHVVSMGKHGHKMVQWICLKPIKKKIHYISRFSWNSMVGILCHKILYRQFLITSVFDNFSFVPAQPVLVVKFWYNNYLYQFRNFENPYDKNWYQYRACLWSRPCLLQGLRAV